MGKCYGNLRSEAMVSFKNKRFRKKEKRIFCAVFCLSIFSLSGVGFSSWLLVQGGDMTYRLYDNVMNAGEVATSNDGTINLKVSRSFDKKEFLKIDGADVESFSQDNSSIEKLNAKLTWSKKQDSVYGEDLLKYFDYQDYDSSSIRQSPYLYCNNLQDDIYFDTHLDGKNYLSSSLYYSNSYEMIDQSQTVDWNSCAEILDYTSEENGYEGFKTIKTAGSYRWDIARRYDSSSKKYYDYTSYIYFPSKMYGEFVGVKYATHRLFTVVSQGTTDNWWPSDASITVSDNKKSYLFTIQYTAKSSSGTDQNVSANVYSSQQSYHDPILSSPSTDWNYIYSCIYDYVGNGYRDFQIKYNNPSYFRADLARRYDAITKKYYDYTVFIYFYTVENGVTKLNLETIELLPNPDTDGTTWSSWPTLTLSIEETSEGYHAFRYKFTYRNSSNVSMDLEGVKSIGNKLIVNEKTMNWSANTNYPVTYTNTGALAYHSSKSMYMYNHKDYRVDFVRRYDATTKKYYDFSMFVYYFIDCGGVYIPTYFFKEFLPEAKDGITANVYPTDFKMEYDENRKAFDYTFKITADSGIITTYEGTISVADRPLVRQESMSFSRHRFGLGYTGTNATYGGFKDYKNYLMTNDYKVDVARRFDAETGKYYDYTVFVIYYTQINFNQRQISWTKKSFLSDLETEGITDSGMWPTDLTIDYDNSNPHFICNLNYVDNGGASRHLNMDIYTTRRAIGESIGYRGKMLDESRPITGYAYYENAGADGTGGYRNFRLRFNGFWDDGTESTLNDTQIKLYDAEWGGYEFDSFAFTNNTIDRTYYLHYIFSDPSGNQKVYTRNLGYSTQTRYYFYQIADLIQNDTIDFEYNLRLVPKDIYKDKASEIFRSFDFDLKISMVREDISHD